MIDRSNFLSRAGAGAAGFSLAQMLGPAAALAGDGGGDFPAHPRWRFVFVSHETLDPLFVATQFGAQDAAALVRCTMQWSGSPRGSVKETVKALRSAISDKADGIAVSVLDGAAIAPVADSAARAGIPLVAFNVDSGSSGRRYAYVGENPRASGVNVGVEIARLAPTGTVVLFTPQQAKTWTERRLQGILTGLAASRRAPAATVVRLSGDAAKQQSAVEKAYARERGIRGLFAVDGLGTLACGRAISHLGLSGEGCQGRWLRPSSGRSRAGRRRDTRLRRRPAAVRPGVRAGAAALPRADLAGGRRPVGYRDLGASAPVGRADVPRDEEPVRG